MNKDHYLTVTELAETAPFNAFSKRHVSERITRRPGFPIPIRIGVRRFWKRSEITKWVEGMK